MKIDVNGEGKTVTGTTVSEVLAELGLGEARVATALNGVFLPKAARDSTALKDGDRLEVLAAMQGG